MQAVAETEIFVHKASLFNKNIYSVSVLCFKSSSTPSEFCAVWNHSLMLGEIRFVIR